MISEGISVVVPVFNSVNWLSQSIESIVDTGYPCLDIVIVDDGSSDGSQRLARQIADKYPETVQLITHQHNKNLGPGVSRNVGVARAKYDIISFLDSDDVYCPNRFSCAPRLLRDRRDIDAVVEPIRTSIEGRGAIRQGTVMDVVGFSCKDPDSLFERAFIRPTEPIVCGISGITIRKTAFDYVGGFSENRSLPEDAVFRSKLLSWGRILSGQEQIVAIYRIHGDNYSNASLVASGANYWALIEVLEWIKRKKMSAHRYQAVKEFAMQKGYFVCSELYRANSNKLARNILIDMLQREPRLLSSRRYWGNALRASGWRLAV